MLVRVPKRILVTVPTKRVREPTKRLVTVNS